MCRVASVRLRSFLLLAAVAGLGFVASACAADSEILTGTSVAAGDSTPRTSGVRFGATTMVGGAAIDLNAVAAARPVVFWFWAPG